MSATSIRCCCDRCAGRVHFLCIADWLDHTSPDPGEAASRAAHPSARPLIEADQANPHGMPRPEVTA